MAPPSFAQHQALVPRSGKTAASPLRAVCTSFLGPAPMAGIATTSCWALTTCQHMGPLVLSIEIHAVDSCPSHS